MKKLLFLLLSVMVFVSCQEKENSKSSKNDQKVEQQEDRPLKVEDDNGNIKEWYPGHEQLKMSGRKNRDGERTGIWKYYSKEGVELSVSVYSNGLRDGHIVVKRPNGALEYVGEYAKDEPVGVWEFYDEKGKLIKTKDYDKE